MPEGSGFPVIIDNASSFTAPASASAKWGANLPNEIALAMEATQLTVGADPLDLSSIGHASAFGDIATMLQKLARVEVGTSANFSSGQKSKTITTTSGRFTDLSSIMVMLSPEGSYRPQASGNDIELFTIYDLRSLSGGNFTFDIYRRLPATHNAVAVKWLAIEWS